MPASSVTTGTLRTRATNVFDRLTATGDALPGKAFAATLVAVAASSMYLYVVMSSGVAGWRVLYATHAPSGVVASPGALTGDVIVTSSLVVVALVAVVALRRWAPPSFLTPARPTAMMTFGAALLLLPTLGAVTTWVWNELARTWPAMNGPVNNINFITTAPGWSVNGLSVGAIRSLEAGISEELLALAIPIWVAAVLATASKAGHRSRIIGVWGLGAFLVAARIGYHLWQGPVAFIHLPWAIATVWFFLTTRRVMPIIFAHIIGDIGIVIANPAALNGWRGDALTVALPLALGAVVVAVATYRQRHKPRTPTPVGDITSSDDGGYEPSSSAARA